MKSPRRSILSLVVAYALICASATSARAQMPAVIGRDSITITAGPAYNVGGFHRSLFGENYRAEWTTPIKIPILDLATFAGGLTPTKVGGGRQTKSLRFMTSDSTEFVFRPVFKAQTILPEHYDGTLIYRIFRDQGSASHPSATVAAAPFVEAAGILHATPRLALMPDDPRLGEFRHDFANVFGTIEEYPTVPVKGHAFAGASKIVDADELLELINTDPRNQVDPRTFLRARLIDMVIGDNDRHPDQWRWAQLSNSPNALWEPIPRDRDKVFLSYGGSLIAIARRFAPGLVHFDGTYPPGTALFENASEFDRRLTEGLDRSQWRAEAVAVRDLVTDAVIARSVGAMPKEYVAHAADIIQKLRTRRDGLPEAAVAYYDDLWTVAEIHGTDASELATITRNTDGTVTVQLQPADGSPYLTRKFQPNETDLIRVYLHGGDDRAVVIGSAPSTIKLTVVGGNGTNTFKENSTVAGKPGDTRFYDEGTVSGVKYAPDTVMQRSDPANELNERFNRRPWLRAYGTLIPPQKDRGVVIRPVLGVKTRHGIGLVPRVGITRTSYGFRYVPYKTEMQGDVAYSFVHRGYALNLFGDKRIRSSDLHIPVDAAVTQLDIVQFGGLGNDVPERDTEFYNVKQTAWHASPGIGLSLNEASDITVGPIIRYTSTDSTSNHFISQLAPYGFTKFGQAGARLRTRLDSRPRPDTLRPRVMFDGAASAYPGMWDVSTAYQSLEGAVTGFINLPFATRPVIALRGGGKKLYGSFPYFDAAFIGGGKTLRTEYTHRYAGDASLFGSGELRVPIAKFPLIIPLDVGLLGFTEAAKVYLDGESPGGWHRASGAGFWVGFLDPGKSVNVLLTNSESKRLIVSLGFAY